MLVCSIGPVKKGSRRISLEPFTAYIQQELFASNGDLTLPANWEFVKDENYGKFGRISKAVTAQ